MTVPMPWPPIRPVLGMLPAPRLQGTATRNTSGAVDYTAACPACRRDAPWTSRLDTDDWPNQSLSVSECHCTCTEPPEETR